VKKKGVS